MPAHQTPAQSQCTDFIGDCPKQPKIVTNVIFQLQSRQSTPYTKYTYYFERISVPVQLCTCSCVDFGSFQLVTLLSPR